MTEAAKAHANPPRNSFSSDVLKLVSGTTIAQVLTILASPVITRIYDPEAFGLSALFVSIVGIISVTACLRYEIAIMLPEKDEEAANLLSLSLLFVFLVSMLTVPITWFGQQSILRLLNAPELGPYLWLVPPYVFVSGSLLGLGYWNSRTKQFGCLSVARVASSIAATGTQLGAGFAGFSTGGSLIGANIVGSTALALMLGGHIWRNDSQLLKESINLQGIIAGLRRYKKFPLIDTWSTLVNTVSWQLPTLLLASFFSATVVGYYALGFVVVQLPMSLIGGSIAQVFFQRATVAKKEGTLDAIVLGIFRYLVIFSMFPMLLLTIVGKDFFIVIFGAKWAEAGVYTQILGIWAIFWFISSPLGAVISVLEKQEYGLKLSAANFITRFIAIGIGGVLNNARLAIFLFALFGLLIYGYLCMLVMDESGVARSNVFRILVYYFSLFMPAGAILITLKAFHVSSLIEVIVSCILFTIYVLYIMKTDQQILGLINRIIASIKSVNAR